jgi:ABC-type uncharacterized transport system involved in gliding motility auxiliary subunit
MMEPLRRRALLFSWTGAAMLLAALAAANLLSYFLFARADLSANRAYSISSGTKRLLGDLRDTLTIKAYYTPRLPPPYGLDRQYLADLLAEYKSSGHGRVKVEMLDPDREKIRREAAEAGVAPLQLSVMGRDKFEVKESFMGLVFLYRGKTEVIPVLNGTADLEYELTRRIKKLVSTRQQTVGFVTGHGEASPSYEPYAPVFEQIREQMNARSVSLEQPLPADIDALWIWAPADRFKPAEIERLKAWAASGRSLGLLLSKRDVDYRSFLARPVETGLESLLAQWGAEITDAFVVDAQAEKIQLESSYGFFRAVSVVDYPYIPVATKMNSKHPAVRSLDAVSFPFTGAVRPLASPAAPIRFTSLVDSSPASWLRRENNVNPGGAQVSALAGQDRGPFCLAAVLEGDFAKATPTTAVAVSSHTASLAQARPGRVILVGTGKMAQPQFAGKRANLAFLMNLLEWSLQDDTLLSIRSKGSTYRPLRAMPSAAVILAKYALVLFPSAALLIIGAWIYVARRKSRRLLAEGYGE